MELQTLLLLPLRQTVKSRYCTWPLSVLIERERGMKRHSCPEGLRPLDRSIVRVTAGPCDLPEPQRLMISSTSLPLDPVSNTTDHEDQA